MEKPRYQRKVNITCGLWDAYKDFKKQYKFIYKIERKEYVDICHAINEELSNMIIKESVEIRLPARLGSLSIRKNKMKIKVKDGKIMRNKLIPDWGKTWKYWEELYPNMTRKEIWEVPDKTVIYNMNEHTNGYIMTWVWDKSNSVVHNRTVYNFRPVKYNRLRLAEWINSEEKENDYYLEKKFYGSKGIREESLKMKMQEHDN